jgi:O-acetyl-ADP-ribose deacetylase
MTRTIAIVLLATMTTACALRRLVPQVWPPERRPLTLKGDAFMKIELVRGDITERRFDAIVNGANTWLIPGGGIDGAIHRAGGPSIFEACRRVITEKHPGGLMVGQAVATTAGRLPAKWVIHAVGPIYSQRVDRSEQLIAAYRSCLRVADEVGAKTIAFPALSTGAYAYPPEEAARLAVEAVQFAKTRVEYGEFVLLDIVLFDAFMKAMFDERLYVEA